MNKSELAEKTDGVSHVFQRHLGAQRFKGVIPGTGWKKGLEGIFVKEGSIPYSILVDLPEGGEVSGHSKSVEYGTVDGNPVLNIGRIHSNESKDPSLPLAMRMVLDAIAANLDGLVITNGVGTLHGPIPDPRGKLIGMLRTWGIDLQALLMRSRAKQEISTGDVCVVDSFDTRYLGQSTPLLSGEFVDTQHAGYERDDRHYLNLAQEIVAGSQGKAPLARLAYLFGPQFEDTGVKLALRKDGCDVVGMSGAEGIIATNLNIPFIHLALATNGAFAPHTHKGNEATGETKAGLLGEILKNAVTTEWSV